MAHQGNNNNTTTLEPPRVLIGTSGGTSPVAAASYNAPALFSRKKSIPPQPDLAAALAAYSQQPLSPPPSTGITASFSQTSLANVSKSLSTLDAVKVITKDVAADVTHTDNVWQAVCVRVLPLFNGQGLKGYIEDLNDLVSQWLHERETVPTGIVEEIYELFGTGMLTLSNKLSSVGDDAFATRIVELWTFFFGSVVPYLEGVFLPVRTEWPLKSEPPDIRGMALLSFRNTIILPFRGRLEDALPQLFKEIENGRKVNDTATRLVQMLSIVNGLSFAGEPQKHITELLVILKKHMWWLGRHPSSQGL
ncbi:hypothetical protein HK104_011117 [Borealophlyctis nickersoniae]|nr:hypothetical protein HK104_011117 [Borealophlyctis nickersoniae]